MNITELFSLQTIDFIWIWFMRINTIAAMIVIPSFLVALLVWGCLNLSKTLANLMEN